MTHDTPEPKAVAAARLTTEWTEMCAEYGIAGTDALLGHHIIGRTFRNERGEWVYIATADDYAQDLSRSRKTVSRARRTLVALGVLRVTKIPRSYKSSWTWIGREGAVDPESWRETRDKSGDISVTREGTVLSPDVGHKCHTSGDKSVTPEGHWCPPRGDTDVPSSIHKQNFEQTRVRTATTSAQCAHDHCDPPDTGGRGGGGGETRGPCNRPETQRGRAGDHHAATDGEGHAQAGHTSTTACPASVSTPPRSGHRRERGQDAACEPREHRDGFGDHGPRLRLSGDPPASDRNTAIDELESLIGARPAWLADERRWITPDVVRSLARSPGVTPDTVAWAVDVARQGMAEPTPGARPRNPAGLVVSKLRSPDADEIAAFVRRRERRRARAASPPPLERTEPEQIATRAEVQAMRDRHRRQRTPKTLLARVGAA